MSYGVNRKLRFCGPNYALKAINGTWTSVTYKSRGSCYYLISTESDQKSIGFYIASAVDMKVYVYEGSRRFPVSLSNGAAKVNKLYKGFTGSSIVVIS